MGMMLGMGTGVVHGQRQSEWFAQGMYADASFVSDFQNDRYALNGVGVSASDIWSVTRSSGGYAQQANGTLKYYPADTLRIGGEGVLVESSRTNMLRMSEQFSNALWVKSNAQVASSVEVSPDPEKVTEQLTDDSSSGTGEVYIEQSVTFSTSTQYVISVYAKANGLSWLRLAVTGMSTMDLDQYFDISAIDVGSQGANVIASGIDALGNGWARCWIKFTSHSSDGAAVVRLQLAAGDGVDPVDLDGGSSVYVWGAQAEANIYPSSYIVTQALQATRPIDVIKSSNVLAGFMNQTHGTILAGCFRDDFSKSPNGRIYGFSGAEGLDVNDDNLSGDAYYGNPSTIGAQAGDQHFDSPGGALAAFSWDADVHQRQLVISDGAVSWDRVGDFGFSGSDLWIGSRTGSQNVLDGYVSVFAIWPDAYVWDELEALTRVGDVSPDYYLSDRGDDAYDGLSLATAKQTPAAALALMSNGDVLGIQGGSIFADALNFSGVGLTGCIAMKAGGGADPVFRGRDVIDGAWSATPGHAGVYEIEWQADDFLNAGANDTYVSVWVGDGTGLQLSDAFMEEATSLAHLQTLDDGFWMDRTTWVPEQTNTLYIRLSGGDNPNTTNRVLSATKRLFAVHMGTDGHAKDLTGDGNGADDGAIIASRSSRCRSYNTVTHGIFGRPNTTTFDTVLFHNEVHANRSRPSAIYPGGQGSTDIVCFAGDPWTNMRAHVVGCKFFHDKDNPALYSSTGGNVFGHTAGSASFDEFIIYDCHGDIKASHAYSGGSKKFTLVRSSIQKAFEAVSAEGSEATYVRILKNFLKGDDATFSGRRLIQLTLAENAECKILGNVLLGIDTSGGWIWSIDAPATAQVIADYNTMVRLSGTANTLGIRNQSDSEFTYNRNVFDGGNWAVYDDAGGSTATSDNNTYNDVKIHLDGIDYSNLVDFQTAHPSRDINSNQGAVDWASDPSTWTKLDDAVTNIGSLPKEINSGAEHFVSSWD